MWLKIDVIHNRFPVDQSKSMEETQKAQPIRTLIMGLLKQVKYHYLFNSQGEGESEGVGEGEGVGAGAGVGVGEGEGVGEGVRERV